MLVAMAEVELAEVELVVQCGLVLASCQLLLLQFRLRIVECAGSVLVILGFVPQFQESCSPKCSRRDQIFDLDYL